MIIVLGSINLDLIANVPRLPSAGETLTGSNFKTAPGGKGANQALAARKAGAQVAMIGAVGKDAHARDALALLQKSSVDCDAIDTTDQPTGTALILVGDDTGDNMIAVIPGANATLTDKNIEALMPSAKDTVLLQLEVPLPAVSAALTRAKTCGAQSILNIAPWQEGAGPLCQKCDILIANETEFDLAAEALDLKGASREARMADYVEQTGNIVIVTLGADGAVAQTPEARIIVPTIKVDAIDSVGAGDTFCGYLAAMLGEGKSLKDALKIAAVAGALACTKQGAQPAIPLIEEVNERAFD